MKTELNVCFWLPFQPIDATHAANRSAGVSKSNVFRGRSLTVNMQAGAYLREKN